MVVLDFYNTQSCYKFQFQKLLKKFCFHRNQCKIQKMYSNVYDQLKRCFSKLYISVLIGHASYFHFPLCWFVKITFCAVQNTKDKLTFSKIENMQISHFVPSVALNFNNFTCI